MAKKSHYADTVIDAALALAAERGWRGLALADIAERAGITLGEMIAHFPDKTAILSAYMDRVDQHMMAGATDRAEASRDRLFDVIMRRFDAMAADRKALAVILRQSADDPWTWLCGGRRAMRSMALVLETGCISSSGLRGLAKIHAVAAVYFYSFKTFLDDDSADLARTMAAVDKGLKRLTDCKKTIFRRPSGISASPASDERQGA